MSIRRLVRVPVFITPVLLATTSLASAQSGSDDASASSALPIERITLYRSGVGAFERSGVVEGDADIQLMVDAELVNDILKSMVLMDLGDGRVESASYGSREPLARRLASFAVDLSDAPSRADLLARLRGTPVKLKLVDGTIEGRVLSVEKTTTPLGDGTATLTHVTLATESGIESIRLDQVRSFEVMDPAIRREINRALSAIAEHRTDQTKTLDLAFRGNGERDVFVGYVHEMPVWKTSYRLVLDEEEGEKPFLQGWAIVENTTDEDWEDVTLGLASGRPVGFVMDLYEPLYLSRPEVPVPVEMAAAPKVYQGDVSRQPSAAPAPARRNISGRERAAGARADYAMDSDAVAELGVAMKSTAGFAANDMRGQAAAASGAEGGAVFRYELDQPVTIERRRSAMLPIAATPLEGRSVSIWSGSGVHPMRGAMLTNTSGLQLMPGPISVYDSGSYAGDAQIDFVPDGDERLISFAMDLEMRVRNDTTPASRVRGIRIVDGMIEQTIGREETRKFSVKNADVDRDRTLIIETPIYRGWDLMGVKPASETETHYRFEVAMKPDSEQSLTVKLGTTDRSMIGITQMDLKTMLAYQRDGRASKAVLDAFRRAGELQSAINSTQQSISRLEAEREGIFKDQKRLRDNLARVQSNSNLGARYIEKLNTQETRLEEIETSIEQLQDRRAQQQRALNDFVRGLNVS